MKRITKYCQSKGITLNDLAQIVGVNINTIKLLDKNPRLNTTIKTIDSIFVGTLAKFGQPLEASYYLDWPFLQYRPQPRVEMSGAGEGQRGVQSSITGEGHSMVYDELNGGLKRK